jgi:hypothetical protein
MPEQIYQVSLPALVSIGWIETCGESPGISRNLPESPGVPGETAAEGKGTEGKGTEEQQLLSATADAPAPVLTAKEFEMAWNSQVANVPKVKAWTAGRAAKLKTRLADPYWRDNWRAALAKIGASPFLQGDGSTGWRADVDWFLKPDSVARILEGKYDGNGTGTGRGNTGSRTFASAAEQAGKFDGR